MKFNKDGFWRSSGEISRREKFRNRVIKQKIKVTRSFLDDSVVKHEINEINMPREWETCYPIDEKEIWKDGICGMMKEMEED